MNVTEDYDDKIEHSNIHPDILTPADNDDKLLESDSVVLCKALNIESNSVILREAFRMNKKTVSST